MINIENKIYTLVRTAIKTQTEFANVMTMTEYVESPESFPCVVFQQEDNYTYEKTQDGTGTENHCVAVFLCNIFATGDSKKAITEKLADLVDSVMISLKFTRTMRIVVPNLDRSVYRLTLRYRAVIASGEASGDNIVYQMYRQ